MFKLKSYLGRVKRIFARNSFIFATKKYLRSRSLVDKIVLFSGISVGILISYMLIAFWSVSPAELALAQLKDSWQQKTLCHEACSSNRWRLEKIIILALRADFSKNNFKIPLESPLAKSLQHDFKTEQQIPGFQERIVNIWRQAVGKDHPALYLKEYLSYSQANSLVQTSIIDSFSSFSLSSSTDSLGLKVASPLTYYFKLLSSGNPALQQAAIQALSAYSNKSQDFSEEQLVVIKKIVLNPKINNHLRQSLVLLLSDYYPLFSKKSADILLKVYNLKSSGDVISRVFAADILNQKAQANLVLETVSSAKWREYYNN